MGKKEIPVSKKFSAPPSPVLGMSKTMDQGQQQEDGILRGTHMEDANQFNKQCFSRKRICNLLLP